MITVSLIAFVILGLVVFLWTEDVADHDDDHGMCPCEECQAWRDTR